MKKSGKPAPKKLIRALKKKVEDAKRYEIKMEMQIKITMEDIITIEKTVTTIKIGCNTLCSFYQKKANMFAKKAAHFEEKLGDIRGRLAELHMDIGTVVHKGAHKKVAEVKGKDTISTTKTKLKHSQKMKMSSSMKVGPLREIKGKMVNGKWVRAKNQGTN